MAEVFFYHLEAQPLKQVLPSIVARALERQWRMVIETSDPTRLSAISEMLWAAEDVAFLPHGVEGDADADRHPVWLTTTSSNPNNATVRVYLDGAMPLDLQALNRAVLMFDGNDEGALQSARVEWKKRKSEGHEISYWKQDENGKWKNQAT